MLVAPFNTHHETNKAEIARFGRGIKAQKGKATQIQILALFQVILGNLQGVVHFHDIDDGAAHVFTEFAKFSIQLTHL